MLTLTKLTELNNRPGHAERLAITDGVSSLSWGDLERLTRRLVTKFREASGERVVFLARNRPELVALLGAFATLGIPALGIDAAASLAQQLNSLAEFGATLVVYDAVQRERAEDLARGGTIASVDLDEAVRVGEANASVGCIVAVSHRASASEGRTFEELTALFGVSRDDVFLVTMPLHHAASRFWTDLHLSNGCGIVLGDAENEPLLADQAIAHNVTALFASPAVLEGLTRSWEAVATRPALRVVIAEGVGVPRGLRRRVVTLFGPVMNEYYGATATGVNAVATAADLQVCPASAGRILASASIAILGDDGQRLPDGQVGKVAVASGADRYLVTPDYGTIQNGRVYLRKRALVLGVVRAAEG